MNFFKKMNIFNTKGNYFTILTGGHQKYTLDLVSKILNKNSTIKLLILNKNYESTSNHFENINEQYSHLDINPEKIQLFNCNLQSQDDIEELLIYINSKNIIVTSYLYR